MKKVKLIFPDGSTAEVDESEVSAAISAGAKRTYGSTSTKVSKSSSMVFPDGSIADVDDANINDAIKAGAKKKAQDGTDESTNGLPEDSGILDLAIYSGSKIGATSTPSQRTNPPVKSVVPDYSANPLFPRTDSPFEIPTATIFTNDGTPINIPNAAKIGLTNDIVKGIQERVTNKTATPQDINILSSSTGKTPNVISAYITKGKDAGNLTEFEDGKIRQNQNLTSLLERTNDELGVYFEPTLINNPQVLSKYLNDIEVKYKEKSAADEQALRQSLKADRSGNMTTTQIRQFVNESNDKIKEVNALNMQKLTEVKNAITDKIKEQIALNPNIKGEEKTRQILNLTEKREQDLLQTAKAMRVARNSLIENTFGNLFNPVAESIKNITDNGDKEDEEILNADKAFVEADINQKIAERIHYNYLKRNKIDIERVQKEKDGTLTPNESDIYDKQSEEIADELSRLRNELTPRKELHVKYPILLKKDVVNEVNDFLAKRSTNVVGGGKQYDNGVNIEEHLKANGYDLKNPVVRDVILEARMGTLGKGSLKDYSLFGRLGSDFKDVFISSAKSIGDITGIRDDVDILADKKEDELFPTQVGENDEYKLTGTAKTLQNIAGTTGQVLGQGILQMGGMGIGRLAGLTKVAAANPAFWGSGVLTTYDNAYKDSYDISDTSLGRTVYAGLNSLFSAGIEKLFPEAKIFQISGVKDAFSEIANKAGTKELTKTLTKELLNKGKNAVGNYIEKFGTNVGKEVAEEVGTSIFESGMRFLYGDPNMNLEKAVEQAKETAYQTATGMALIGGIGAHKDISKERNLSARSVVYNAAVYNDEAIDAINKGFKQGLYSPIERDQKIQTVHTAMRAVKAVDQIEELYQRELPRAQREIYVGNLTAEALLKKQFDQLPESDQTDEVGKYIQDKIKNLQEQRKQIVKDEVTIDDFGNVKSNKKEELYFEPDQDQTFYVQSVDEIPEQYRDRAVKIGETKTRKALFGIIPYGKEEVVSNYRYTIKGSEANELVKNNATNVPTEKTKGAAIILPENNKRDNVIIGIGGDKSAAKIESAIIEINGKTYEGKNHAEAILAAQADGQDISQVDRQASGKFKLSDGTVIDRTEAKARFGQDRSELLIPQDEAANQANKDYRKITGKTKPTETVSEPIGSEKNKAEIEKEFENIDTAIEASKLDEKGEFEGRTTDELLEDRKLLKDDPARYFASQMDRMFDYIKDENVKGEDRRHVEQLYNEYEKIFNSVRGLTPGKLNEAAKDLFDKPYSELNFTERNEAHSEADARIDLVEPTSQQTGNSVEVKPEIKVGDELDTPFGKSVVDRVRDNGVVMVKLGDGRVIMYTPDSWKKGSGWEPGKSKVEEPTNVSTQDAEVKTIEDAIKKHDEVENYTFQDMVNDVDNIANESGNKKLIKAVEDYRKAQEEDNKLSGRGDMDTAEKEFLNSLTGDVKQSTNTGKEVTEKKESSKPEIIKPPEVKEEKKQSKLLDLADRIEKEGFLPSWAKADLPEGTQLQGFNFNKAVADALRAVDAAIKKGTEIAKAIEEGFEKIRQHFKDNNAKFKDEEKLKSDFTKFVKDNFEEDDGMPPSDNDVTVDSEDTEGKRKFTKQELNNPEIRQEAKDEIAKNISYVIQTNSLSVAEAKRILDSIGVDEAYDLVVNNKELKPAVRVVLGQILILKYNDLAVKSTTQQQKDYYHDKTIDAANYVAEELGTKPGQMIQALSLFQRLTPEAQLRAAQKEVKQQSTKKKSKRRKDVNAIGDKFKKANEETVDNIINSEKVKSKVKDAENITIKKAKDKIAQAKIRRENIIKKYKGDKGKMLYSSAPGLTKEGIEFVGNLAKTYLDEGIANVEIIAAKIYQHLKDASGKDIPNEVQKNVSDIVNEKFNESADKVIATNLKELEKEIGEIIRKHYTVDEDTKTTLTQKFVIDAGLAQPDAEVLAKEIESEFDRIASRKKNDILQQEKTRFDRIQKGLQGSKKVEPRTLHEDMIRYSNLGAFSNESLEEMISKKLGLGSLSAEDANKIVELAKKIQKSPEGSPKNEATEDLLRFRSQIKGTSMGEMAQAIWYANILSGYGTHIKNIVSTFFNGMFFAATEAVRDPKSIPILMVGGAKGLKRGLTEAWHTLTTGRSPIHISKIETPTTLERVRFIGGYFNPYNYLKFVGRLMIAEDVLQFQGLKEMRATQLAYKEAKRLGSKNPFSKETWKIINEKLLNTKERYSESEQQANEEGFSGVEKRRRIYELMEESRPIQMTEDSYGFAAKGTFNHEPEGSLGAITNAISSVLDIDVAGIKPLRFFIPFTRIITNVANNMLDFSPVGLVRAARGVRGFESFERKNSTKGAYHVMTPEERKQTIAKASLGIGLTVALYVLTKIDWDDDDEPLIEITGNGTGDYKKDAQLRQTGWQPYSIKIGKTYYSYALTPLMMNLAWIGNRSDREKYDKNFNEESEIERVMMSVYQSGQMLSDMTWIGSSADLLKGMVSLNPSTMGKAVESSLKNSAKGLIIPNAYSQLAQKYEQIYNIPQKEVKGFWQELIQDIPIARNTLNDKINALGQPVIRDRDLLISTETPDPTWKFLLDKKGWVSPINKNSLIIRDNKTNEERIATEDEYYNFSKKRGEKIKALLDKIIEDGAWTYTEDGKKKVTTDKKLKSGVKDSKDLTTLELRQLLKAISAKATKEAKKELFSGSPDVEEDEQ